ncbi:MAG TPA: class II glutamine amidotransferase [Solirubrobacteraceae bacterium]|nr:class II glutamine amidotransferase [Solirubrobacteraceae bacterium]
MCRLFGMSGAPIRVRATFWLLEAPDSLAEQSRREPDGTGLGSFDPIGHPEVAKQPLAAYEDQAFAREAREVSSATFVAHVRYASTGGLVRRNTHPFEQHGRLFAHNGVIQGLDALDAELGSARALVHGDTDSERFFALITREIERAGGDVAAGIAAAAGWVARELPVLSLNLVLITARELWALRYPDTHELYVLERSPGGPHGGHHLDHASARGSLRVRSGELAARRAVVVATERMDEDPGWRPLSSGELLHVDPAGHAHRRTVLAEDPVHRLTLAELDPQAAGSQA